MLYGQALALGGNAAAAGVVGAVVAALATAAVFGLGRELGGATAGLAAAGLFTLQGIFTWEATSAFVELGLTFWIVLAVWRGVRRSAVWCGACIGFAAGAKYIGIQAAVLAVPLLLPKLQALGGAAAAAVLTGGLWYVKNWIVAGNPVYPLFFGGKWWTSQSQAVVDVIGHQYGVGNSPLRLALLPIELLVHGNAFDRGQYIDPLIFVAAVLAVLMRRTGTQLKLAAASLVYVTSWWFLSPQARFLLPVLAVLAAVGGSVVATGRAWGWRGRTLVIAALLAVVVDWAAPSFALARRALPAALGVVSQREYLQEETGTYNALRAASGRAAPVLALSGYDFVYHARRPTIFLGVPEFASDVPTPVFRARLRRERIHSILDAHETIASYPQLRGCLRRVASYHAQFVLSRSRGTAESLTLTLYRLVPPCAR